MCLYNGNNSMHSTTHANANSIIAVNSGLYFAFYKRMLFAVISIVGSLFSYLY